MSSPFKIEMESKRYPATFAAFDCLYYNGQDLTGKPLTERKAYLDKAVRETERLAISRTFPHTQAGTLFALAQKQGLEGVVAKRLDSLYIQGKRTKNWMKIKNLLDDDYVICGWVPKENHMTSLVLGQYREGRLVCKGHVTLGVGGEAFAVIRKQPRAVRPAVETPEGHGNENVRWIEPRLVCTVQFMYKTNTGSLRQPVFKGLRDDKEPEDCVEA